MLAVGLYTKTCGNTTSKNHLKSNSIRTEANWADYSVVFNVSGNTYRSDAGFRGDSFEEVYCTGILLTAK